MDPFPRSVSMFLPRFSLNSQAYTSHTHMHTSVHSLSHIFIYICTQTPQNHTGLCSKNIHISTSHPHPSTHVCIHVTGTHMCTHTPSWSCTNMGVLRDLESTRNLTHACTHSYINIRLTPSCDHTRFLTYIHQINRYMCAKAHTCTHKHR